MSEQRVQGSGLSDQPLDGTSTALIPEPRSLHPSSLGALSQFELIQRKFVKHKLAVVSMLLLVVLYTMAILAEFFAPYSANWKDLPHAYCPPQKVRFSFTGGFYTHPARRSVDPITFKKSYYEDRRKPCR